MLYIEPNTGVEPVVKVIQQAQHSVEINAWLIDDRAILSAIRSDVRRGVIVQVIAESRPQGVPYLRVVREYQLLAAAGAQLRWAPPRFTHRFAQDHAKYIVDDDGKGPALISTANFTYAGFHKNRDYLWISHNPIIARVLAKVFQADWNRRHAGAVARNVPNLVISPGGEKALIEVIDQPGPIDMQSMEFGYIPRINYAFERKGKLARIIVPIDLSAYDRGNLAPLIRHGVQVRFLNKPYPHAKMLVGNRLAFIGSQNISWVSLHHNREVGIILRGRAVKMLRQQFDRDWETARPMQK